MTIGAGANRLPEIDHPESVLHAAGALIGARDSLAWTLEFLAERTAITTAAEAAKTLAKVLGAVPLPERERLARALADAGQLAYGAPGYPDDLAENQLRDLALDVARRIIRETAAAAAICPTAVR